MRAPRSLVFLLITAIVFALQAFPFTGIFLMILAAPFWSVVLVNAGMIGTAIEAVIGRASRIWLLLPLAFYGGYSAYAASDRVALAALRARYAAHNAGVTVPFNVRKQALIFAGAGDGGGWFVQNYDLPVVYAQNPNFPEKHLSHRIMATDICAKVRESPALGAAFVHAFGFHDGDELRSQRREMRFCDLRMPERPELPPVTVMRRETKGHEGSLPVLRVAMIVDTRRDSGAELWGGTASPLPWFPMPVMGCALNSGAPSWDCDAGFFRRTTPILPGTTRYNRDSIALAAALGLKPVAIQDRQGGDPTLVLNKLAEVEAATLARQLAAIDRMIADPAAKVDDWQVGVVANRPDALDAKADAIMIGIERAARMTAEPERWKARESGRILAGLIAALPTERLSGFGPRLLGLYAPAGDGHWLWESERLIRRLGDLGAPALPFLLNPRASTSSVNGAGIEGLCRLGAPARAAASALLLTRWKQSRGFDRDERRDLFVAMRRIGIAEPPLQDDARDYHAELRRDWADVSSSSPPRVCATRAEEQARQEERHSGKRRANRA